jgi:Glycogen recognition site of AMP-activated protein kinase
MTSDHDKDDRDPVIQRAARTLGAPERFGNDFERVLVEAIRADRPLRRTISRRARPLSPSWWAASRALRLSPLAGLAMAAGVAAIAVMGTLGVTRRAPAAITARAGHDTVTFVRFVFVGQAKSVVLVGDFNGWRGDSTSMTRASNGAWTVSVPMTNGRHEYAFVVDGTRWVPDPLAPSNSDDFDTKSSIISVGT